MKRKQYWGLVALIILMAGVAVLWVQHERSDIRQPQQEAAEADKLKESDKKKETPEVVNDRSVGAEKANIGKVSDADVEKLHKEVAAEGKVSDADVEKLLKKVTAEEEEVKEVLSVEEIAKREIRQQQKKIFTQIKALIAAEGGAVSTSTIGRQKMDEFLQLQRELFNLQQEIDGIPNLKVKTFFDLAVMVNSSLNRNDQMPVSEYIKLADYMETAGDVEASIKMRAVAQRAIDNGDEVIKPEHIAAEAAK